MNKTLFARFSKANKDSNEVTGILTAEVIDQDGEIFDYDASKKFFKAWNARFLKATDGESKGNVREMHQLVAVGTLKECEYNDTDKVISITAKIVDKQCWKKIEARVYTGFSVGGDLVKSYKDDDGVRHIVVKPVEASVVDNPAVEIATLTVVESGKAVSVTKRAKLVETTRQGGYELRKYTSELGEFVVKDRMSKREEKTVDNKIAKAIAITSFNEGDTAEQFVGRLGVKKGMYDVARLAEVLASISYLRGNAIMERDIEGDDSDIPEELGEWLGQGVQWLIEMVEEEGAELIGGKAAKLKGETTMEAKQQVAAGDVEKKGHAGHFKKLASAHSKIAKAMRAGNLGDAADAHEEASEHCTKLALSAPDAAEVAGKEKAAEPNVEKSAAVVELEKLVAGGTKDGGALETIAKAVATIAQSVEDIRKSNKEQYDDMAGAIDALTAGLAEMGEEPAETKVAKGHVVVEKAADGKGGDEAEKKTGTDGKVLKSADGRDISAVLAVIKGGGIPSPTNGGVQK